MRIFILIFAVIVLVPVIWFMGIKGLSFQEMLINLGIRRE